MEGRPEKRPDPPEGKFLSVVASVADLLAGPSLTAERLTQLLLNEGLRCLGDEGDWYMVEALEQQKLSHEGWRGYPGWIGKDRAAPFEGNPVLDGVLARGTLASAPSLPALYLSAGTRVEMTGERSGDLAGIRLPGGVAAWVPDKDLRQADTGGDTSAKRQRIIETAMSFIDTPYLWGGRSTSLHSFRRHPVSAVGDALPATGVDCSGLVNLSYRAAGIDVPRDARDQHAAARPLPPGRLQPADLIFLTPAEGQGIDHVMLYLGGERFIEAVETGRPVEVGTFRTRFGHSREEMLRGGLSGWSGRIRFASLLVEEGNGKKGPKTYGGR
jgi:cell wall-associated NlpC family hydrolase